ncbi:MAG TPA: di-heme oxidoredictase family protein [Myxococcales bacterium LLY-WYZ-16_1]|nr:di-heme oxidoredictase family protein [Myxococcales bacterium LLY-WYZ-16_1]
MKTNSPVTWALLGGALAACTETDSAPKTLGPPDPAIFSRLGEPRKDITADERDIFERGEAMAEHRFTEAEGLGGPGFNVTFCASCHEKPVFGGSAPRYRNFFLTAEIDINGNYQPLPTNGVQRTFQRGGFVPTSTAADTIATRNAIPFFGAGLIDEIYESEILRNEDADDRDGDGISGKANIVGGVVGRFGRKAQTDNIEGFIRGPLFNHLGITTDPLTPEERRRLPSLRVRELNTPSSLNGSRGSPDDDLGTSGHGQAVAPDAPVADFDGVRDPELQNTELFDLVAWSMLLGAPQPEAPTPETEAGKALFEEVGCNGCHVEALDSRRGPIPLYSDLLLHDMGPELADEVVMEDASGSEFRTQPLWGIGAMAPYLHDGRADTLHDAIVWHGGEGSASRDAYLALREGEREQIIAFLESLGGMDQFTEGLLPPEAREAPPAGEAGGPVTPLAGEDRARFERGRLLFDRDFGLNQGLGPLFNGDSCRACYFDPVLGGSGPAGVNVVRHAILDPSGEFTMPAIDHTIVHRFAADTKRRPPSDDAANVFELRQTPPLFGLGLLERVPESDILARADPDDADQDGISGRASRLPDGRLGRFGWKLDIPNVREFVRDALSTEMGLTLPDEVGHTFGHAEDTDDRPDPEAGVDVIDDLTFFLAELAPLPRRSTEPGAEARGRDLFEQTGCADCHVPTLNTSDGLAVHAYTDLLLHDVAPPGYRGVPLGVADAREFRTTPLWGVSQTAPYMHHGRAATLDAAIRDHHAEAEASRQAYEALSLDGQEDLLTFLKSL